MQVVKGMRDFYPEEMRLREWLFDVFKTASANSGFEFYDAPLVEHEELYTRKAGEEITGQLYTFEDKSGRRLTLRPEMTPSLARMIIARFRQLPARMKWAALAQCFRYERMTRGRKREHFQWNLDILGDASMFAELELISTAVHALQAMGLNSSEVRVRVSNRLLLADVLQAVGIGPEHHHTVFMWIDKLGKVEDSVLQENLQNEGVPMAHRIFEIIRLSQLDEVAAVLGDQAGASEGLAQVQELFALFSNYGLRDWLEFDFSIVRGLAYYTGTVFEFFDVSRGLRAIAGGGRYDRLIENLANQDLSDKAKGSIQAPAVGFGFGDVVILELLKDLGKLPSLDSGIDFCFLPIGEAAQKACLGLLGTARSCGYACEFLQGGKMRKLLERAEQLKASHVLILGSDELHAGHIRLKDLKARRESEVSLEDVQKWLEDKTFLENIG